MPPELFLSCGFKKTSCAPENHSARPSAGVAKVNCREFTEATPRYLVHSLGIILPCEEAYCESLHLNREIKKKYGKIIFTSDGDAE
jgi:hypothetical protein